MPIEASIRFRTVSRGPRRDFGRAWTGGASTGRGLLTDRALGGQCERTRNQAMPANSRTLAKIALIKTMTTSWVIHSPTGTALDPARARAKMLAPVPEAAPVSMRRP